MTETTKNRGWYPCPDNQREIAGIQQERRRIDELKPAEYNPRKRLRPGDDEYENLKRSIETFGYVDPVIINVDGTVIGGHQRLFVLQDLGYAEVDVSVVELNKADEKALNIALNKIGGEWDDEKLAAIFAELDADGYDLGLTGFEQDEIADIVATLVDGAADNKLQEPDAEVPCPETPATIEGDLWKIGRHRLMYGDSTSADALETLMSGEMADLLLTDPPYNVNYEGKTSDALKIQNEL